MRKQGHLLVTNHIMMEQKGWENPVLNQFGKRLLDISGLPDKENKAELMKL